MTQEEPASGRTFNESIVAGFNRQAKATRSELSMNPGKTFDKKFKVEVNKFMEQDRMGDNEFLSNTGPVSRLDPLPKSACRIQGCSE